MGVVASAHGRIDVDPDVLIDAGKRVESLGSQLGMLCDSLSSALGGGISSGADTAGLSFALDYGRQAQDFADTLAKAANAYKAVGRMLQATGYNYKNADAGSTIGGHGAPGAVGPQPSDTVAGDMPAGPNGVMVPPPTMWYLVEPLLLTLPGLGLFGAAMTWPSGNAAMMNVLAAQWRNFATGFAIFQSELNGLKPAVAAQDIPEGAKIGEAFDSIGEAMACLTTTASDLAQHITSFAREVQQTQDAIRRLLDRLSLSGLWDTVTDFFSGDGMKVLREVAHDVGTVLSNFQRQVEGIVGLLNELKNLISDAADAFEKWVRPVLVAQFGDGVGNALADAVTLYTDFEVGIANGLINTVSGVVSMANPEMWEGLAKTAWAVANDPSKAPGVLAEMGKQFIALDQWTGDHPARGAGEAAFNIGSLFVPGGALSKTGSVAKSLNMTRRILDEGRLPKLGEIGPWSRGAPSVEGLGDLPGGQRVPDVPEVRPGAIPDSLVGPSAPHGIDAPTAPRGLVGPSGPPDPPGPQSTPGGPHQGTGGGDGPPPEPPGRSVPPSDSGPGRVDGPSPESSASPHSPDSSAPPAPTHVPESPSPTGTHEAPRAPSESTPAAPAHAPESRVPESNPHASETGPRPVEHQGGPGGGENHSPAGHDAPTASHTPVEHQPTMERPVGHEAPAVHEPSTHEPAAHQPTSPDSVDHGSAQTPTDRNGGQHSAPAPMIGGMPMAPHAAGGMHGPTDAPSRTPTPETPARSPETRAPQGNTPESPRAQSPSGAGPSVERSPQAPVKPAAAHEPGAATATPRPGPETHAPRAGEGTPTPPIHETPHAGDPSGHHPDPSGSSHEPGGGQHPDPDPTGPVGNPANDRIYGPHQLDRVEDPAYQTAVENALRDPHGDYLRHADPRTNDYGNLINDGGPTVDGRANNCLDCSLSALSSFRGEPTVAAPRFLDELPDGRIDRESGERNGLDRAKNWLGEGLLEFPGHALVDQFDLLHRYIDHLGPGSAALVVNGWHGRDLLTGEFLFDAHGEPITHGSHATVILHPEGGGGPVWWDPQQGLTSDRPPAWMVGQSTYLNFTPIEPSLGVHHGGTGHPGTDAGVSGTDVTHRDVPRATVSARVGGDESAYPGTDGLGPVGGSGSAGDRFGDGDRLSVPELVGDHGGRGVHDVQGDGVQPGREPDLSVSVGDHDSTHAGGRGEDRLSTDGGVSDRSTRTDPATPADHREELLPVRSEGSAVQGGGVAREMGQRPESGSVAGDGHHAPIIADGNEPVSNEPSGSDNPAQDSEQRELSAGRTEGSPAPGEQSAHTGADSESNAVNSDEGTHADYSDTGGVPISREKFDEILATEKGQRPPPETYLPAEYIAEHLQNFEDGASRILIRSSYEEYGIGKPDPGRSEFVLTNADAKAMLDESGGDPIKLAQKLGIPEDQLANDSLVIVHFHPTSSYASHMPSGNEWGANDQWLPGGRLPKGDLEAIVHTEDMAKGRDYTVIDIATGDVL
ncbi:PE domain-containing protein [Mycobacterium hackensackense]|uniref:toxin glutamine deamidase domain-containing protein n=1 Tax=Mycobacterium hackensackense TaxID=228909 RepID=UPI002265EABE|nr:toxin glutamine deamidase domain-containing protein [Mycobacterium hackensackense]MCV7252051.1 PE domain-containing protein [Mycobacterium hackensackense]